MPAQLALIACNWAAAASIAGFDKRESSYIEFKPEKRTHSDAAATKVRKNSTIHHKQTSSIGVHLMRDTKTSGGSRDDNPPPPHPPYLKVWIRHWRLNTQGGSQTQLLSSEQRRGLESHFWHHVHWETRRLSTQDGRLFFFITPLSMLGPDKTMMGA